MVQAVTVGTEDAIMSATHILAGGCVLRVVSGEVLASALVTLRRASVTDVGGMSPLETSGALTCGGGDGPRLAPPRGTNKCDRRT